MPVDDYRLVWPWLILKFKIQILLEKLDPRIRKRRANQDCVGILQVFHVKLARITNGETLRRCFWQPRKFEDRVQVSHTRIALLVQVSHILGVDVIRAFDRDVVAADIFSQIYGMFGEVLDHDDAVISRNQKCLSRFSEDLRPQQMRCVRCNRGGTTKECPPQKTTSKQDQRNSDEAKSPKSRRLSVGNGRRQRTVFWRCSNRPHFRSILVVQGQRDRYPV